MEAKPPTSEEYDRFTALVDQVLAVPGLTLPEPPRRDVRHVITPTSRAGDATRPAAGHEVGNAVVWVSEVDNGLLEGFWLIIH